MIKKFFLMKIIAAIGIVLLWFGFAFTNMFVIVKKIDNFTMIQGNIWVSNTIAEPVLLKDFFEKNIFQHDKFWQIYILTKQVILIRDKQRLKILKDSAGDSYYE